MFFIGGFNTAVPYLLYLALIWIFMIIGVSGIHLNSTSGKSAYPFHTHEISTHTGSHTSVSYSVNCHYAADVHINLKLPGYPDSDPAFLAEILIFNDQVHPDIPKFRGPPLFS